VLESTDHVVGIQLRACSRLVQQRDGRSHEQAVRPGDVIVTPAGEPKRWACEEAREFIVLHVDPDVVDCVALGCGGRERTIRLLDNFGARDPAIEAVGRQLLHEAQWPGLASDVHVDAMTTELAVQLIRRYSTAARFDDRAQQLPEHKLKRAREYVDDNLGETLTVHSIATELAMSAYHFAHVFQQTTGQTPHRFVVERRVERAKWLLRHSDAPIIDIAHDVGCRSQAHFAVLFRRETGVTPSDYRRVRDP
jgi:AraC family transcriptional regulator